MQYKCSVSVILCFSLLLVIYPNLGCLASRRLLDDGILPSTPGTNVTYESETRNGAHTQVVYVNGQPESQATTVYDNNGDPVIKTTQHHGSQITTIDDPNGSPRIQANDTGGDHSSIVNGNDGKPKIEVHSNRNGQANVTIYGQDGKPLFNFHSPPP